MPPGRGPAPRRHRGPGSTRRAWRQSDRRLTGARARCRPTTPALAARLEARFANAWAVAERWRKRRYEGGRPDPGCLVEYLEPIGYPLPDKAVGGGVGETIRLIHDRLERGLPPTEGLRARWNSLREHNRHDCVGMRKVCLRATHAM